MIAPPKAFGHLIFSILYTCTRHPHKNFVKLETLYEIEETSSSSVSHSINLEGMGDYISPKAYIKLLAPNSTFKVRQRWRAKPTVFVICNNDIVVRPIKVEQFKVVVWWFNHVNKPSNGVMVVTVY